MSRDQSFLVRWLTLFRFPNLFSIPGDILAGIAIVGGLIPFKEPIKIISAILISLLTYCVGMALNDWADRFEDASERPNRPIPSGAIRESSALNFARFGTFSGLILTILLFPNALIAYIVLIAAVWSYNLFAKKQFFLSSIAMGICRASNVWFGALALGIPSEQLYFIMLVYFIYIALVTAIAFYETSKIPAKWMLLTWFATLGAILFSGANRLSGEGCYGVWIVLVFLILNMAYILLKMWNLETPKKVPSLIGQMIRNVIFMQAFWVAVGTGSNCVWLSLVLLLWPIARYSSRAFYSS
ncbi:MAG: UbiA family prenyltransferase [Lentisphaeria bacterium]|nr:UbiA family prenyltransferase [Lentisphaeria bacterium]